MKYKNTKMNTILLTEFARSTIRTRSTVAVVGWTQTHCIVLTVAAYSWMLKTQIIIKFKILVLKLFNLYMDSNIITYRYYGALDILK